jgi:hypothetical protein
LLLKKKTGKKAAVYVASLGILLVVMGFIQAVASEGSVDVELQLQRQEFVRSKIIDKIADGDQELVPEVQAPDYTVRDKDTARGGYVKTLKEASEVALKPL